MKLHISARDALMGMIIYSVGDSVAALILGKFMGLRLLGMMLIGATVYAFEIPNYFRWIDGRTKNLPGGFRRAFFRTVLALLYFNPVWIARHLLFIRFVSADWDGIGFALLQAALFSWLVNIPIAIAGNYIIQVVLPLRRRFAGSATFSGLMAVYYALAGVWFNVGN